MTGDEWEPTRNDRAVAFALVLVAGVVGAWCRVSLALSSGLWRDEVQSLAVSQLPTLRGMIEFLVREESHPPLFYLIERAWTSVAGTSDAAVAGLGLVPGVLLIPVVAAVAWHWSGPWAGALSAWLVALAWPAVWQAGDGRPYAMLSVVVVAAATAALAALRHPGRRPWAALSACSIVLLYLHNWALLIVMALALLTLVMAWREPAARREQLRRWTLSYGAVALAWLPWAPSVYQQARHVGYVPPAGFPIEWLVVLPILLLGVTVRLFLPAALLILVGAWRRVRPTDRPDPVRFFAATAVVPPLLALGAWPVTDLTLSHCAQVLVPLVMLAVACTVTGRGPGVWRRGGAAVCLVALLAAVTGTWWLRKSNLREMVLRVSAEVAVGDLVVIYPSPLAQSFGRYAAGPLEAVTFPLRVANSPTRFSSYPESFGQPAELEPVASRIRAAASEGRRVWLLSLVRSGVIADSGAPMGTRERWRLDYDARLREIEKLLLEKFGSPELTIPPSLDPPARERVRVERYGVEPEQGSGAHPLMGFVPSIPR